MPKTTSPTLLHHYPPLREISEDEWDQVFDRDYEPWTPEEDEYVRRWYLVENVMDVAYALGRVPWKVQKRAKELGLSTRNGPRPYRDWSA